MHLDVPHKLDPDGARAAVEKAFDHYRTRYAAYNPKLKWIDDQHAEVSFTAKGVGLVGTLTLGQGQIVMDAKVPFLLRPFTKKAVAVIESELQRWLG
jgi:hypothetical protein